MTDIKELLKIAKEGSHKFFYDRSTLNKLFIVRLYTEDYGYLLYRHNVNCLYLNMYLLEDATSTNITIKFMDDSIEISLAPHYEFVVIPEIDAGTDEWFNFNVLNSSLTKDDFYPELEGLGDKLTAEYNRVFLETLEINGL